MRIAWSCAGEGFGHAARMAALEPELGAMAELILFAPPAVRGFLRERLPGRRLHWVPACRFEMSGHRVRHGATFARNAALLLSLPRVAGRLAKRLERAGAEAVLSDFDPFLAWAGRLAGLPVIQLNHPGIVQRYPSFRPREFAAIAATRLMEGPFDRRLHTSFFGGEIGPVIRADLSRERVRPGNYLVLNLRPETREAVLPALRSCGFPYRVFPGPRGYDEALEGCRAVVSGAGHQTMSEALFLGKPLLAIPQDGQYEQRLNALMLERSGAGMATSLRRFPRDLPVFLSRLSSYGIDRGGKGGWRVDPGNAAAVSAVVSAIASVKRRRARAGALPPEALWAMAGAWGAW